MTASVPNSHRRGRGPIVALVVGIATAAIASTVALQQRHPGAALVSGPEASTLAPTTVESFNSAGMRVDPTVPAAADVLERVRGDTGEAAPSF